MVQHKSRGKISLRTCQNRVETAPSLVPGSACKMPVMGKEEFRRCCWLLWAGLDRAGVVQISPCHQWQDQSLQHDLGLWKESKPLAGWELRLCWVLLGQEGTQLIENPRKSPGFFSSKTETLTSIAQPQPGTLPSTELAREPLSPRASLPAS